MENSIHTYEMAISLFKTIEHDGFGSQVQG
jgi:hypothetical protein